MTADDMREILAEVECSDWTFFVAMDGTRPYLQLSYDESDVVTGEPAVQHTRKWFLSPHMTRSELVQTALKAALTSAEHRVREHFLYRGRAVFGPHLNVDKLWEMAEERSFRAPVDDTAPPPCAPPRPRGVLRRGLLARQAVGRGPLARSRVPRD